MFSNFVPQPKAGNPGTGDLTLAFLGEAGVTGRLDIMVIGNFHLIISLVVNFDAAQSSFQTPAPLILYFRAIAFRWSGSIV